MVVANLTNTFQLAWLFREVFLLRDFLLRTCQLMNQNNGMYITHFGGGFGPGHGDGMMLSLQGYGNRTFRYSEMVEFRSEDEVRLDI